MPEPHMITLNPYDFPELLQPFPKQLIGRSMLVKRAIRIPVECVLRLYLAGSGWRSYKESGEVCGIKLLSGMVEADELPEPLFTPATKAEGGLHDENISYEKMVEVLNDWRLRVGVKGGPVDAYGSAEELASVLRAATISLFQAAAEYLKEEAHLILTDGKLEFGIDPMTRDIMVIDEAFTPDSSRFWKTEDYEPGRPQAGLDKEDVRRWLSESGWDKASPPPSLPDEVVAQTYAKYMEAYSRITGCDALP